MKLVRISFKKFSIVALIALIVLGIFMIYGANQITIQNKNDHYIYGPQFYPIMIGSLLVLSSIICIITTLKKPDKIIELRDLHKALFGLAVMIVWILCWQFFGHFYICSFIFCAIMIYFLNPKPLSRHKILVSTLLPDAILVGCVYLIFDVAMKTRM